MADLLARRGYAAETAGEELEQAWAEAVGPELAAKSRPGSVRRGVLAVFAAHSTVVQELTFQETAVVDALRRLAPDAGVQSLRMRVEPDG